MKRALMAICFLLLLNETNSIFWSRRRRRRRSSPSCSAVNCQVGSWTSWSSCSHQCGTSGTQSRTRQQVQAASCGGTCPYNTYESRACNRDNCHYGGTPHSGGCSCRAGYGGTCCEQDVNECLKNPCQHTCTNTHGSFTCSCDSCYTRVGLNCDLRQCKISNQCYAYGTVNPSNQCQDCNSANKLAWTNNNALPCGDNVACTKNDQCSNGVCSGTPFTCLPCEECHSDTCHVKPGFCAINDGGTRKCFNGGALRPGYSCQWCYPCNSSSTWSNRDGVACDDGNKCTRGDTCLSGQCVAIPFTCNSMCHYCNGSGCSLKAGFGFVNNTCMCKIAGQDYGHQALNPLNQCQCCDLYDGAARANITWTNRPAVVCNDHNKCTKHDKCNAGRCVGQGYSCQSSYNLSSCIKTSECFGDGTCRPIMRSSGTICRPAVDVCDQPERCDGSLETCPPAVKDNITLTTGTAQLMDQTFNSVVHYQYFKDKLYIKISGFCVSCGQLTLNWFLLLSKSPCSTTSTVSGTFSNNNLQQILTGLTLKVNRKYKVSIQASDMRNNAPQVVCTGVVKIQTSNHSTG